MLVVLCCHICQFPVNFGGLDAVTWFGIRAGWTDSPGCGRGASCASYSAIVCFPGDP